MKKKLAAMILALTFLLPGAMIDNNHDGWPPNNFDTLYDNLILVTFPEEMSGYGKDYSDYFAEHFPELPILAVQDATYQGYWDWEPTEQEKYLYYRYIKDVEKDSFRQKYILLLDTQNKDDVWKVVEKLYRSSDFCWESPIKAWQYPRSTKLQFSFGDVNADGSTSMEDVKMIEEYLNEKIELTEFQKAKADANFDFKINEEDVEFIEKVIRGELDNPFGNTKKVKEATYYTHECYVYFKPEASRYGMDYSTYLLEYFDNVNLCSVEEETYYHDMWNPTEQEKYIYANWAEATNYMGKGFRQVYGVIFNPGNLNGNEMLELFRGTDDIEVIDSRNYLAENQIPHTELVTFTCGDLDNDGQTTSQDALIILQSIVGLEQLDQYEYALADADFNFTVDSLDALEVLKISVGETEQPF